MRRAALVEGDPRPAGPRPERLASAVLGSEALRPLVHRHLADLGEGSARPPLRRLVVEDECPLPSATKTGVARLDAHARARMRTRLVARGAHGRERTPSSGTACHAARGIEGGEARARMGRDTDDTDSRHGRGARSLHRPSSSRWSEAPQTKRNCALVRGDARLMLETPSGFYGDEYDAAIEERLGSKSANALYIEATDVDGFYDRIRTAGVRVVDPLCRAPLGPDGVHRRRPRGQLAHVLGGRRGVGPRRGAGGPLRRHRHGPRAGRRRLVRTQRARRALARGERARRVLRLRRAAGLPPDRHPPRHARAGRRHVDVPLGRRPGGLPRALG